LIVSAAKVCKQCLHTASASHDITGGYLRPPDSRAIKAPMKIPGASLKRIKTVFHSRNRGTRERVRSRAPMTLTPWPWYATLT